MIVNNKFPGIISYEIFDQFGELTNFTSTRRGGCSEGAYASFNLGYGSGDAKENVDRNRDHLMEILQIERASFYTPKQVHKSEIVVADEAFVSKNKEEKESVLYGKDAIVTNLKRVGIAVSTADCVPILLYDCKRKVIAAVHAGWRGTCKRILAQVLDRMKEFYACRMEDVYAAIGPSISMDAFEVGDEVYEAFDQAGFDMKEIDSRNSFTGKHHIDLWKSNYIQLEEAGLPIENVQLASICTYFHPDCFFSARRLGAKCGRQLNGLYMH